MGIENKVQNSSSENRIFVNNYNNNDIVSVFVPDSSITLSSFT